MPGKSTLTAALPPRLVAAAGSVLGHDLGDVSVHQDGYAERLGTRAFTRGDELHFAAGAFDPSSASGRALIGHELAHVAQQREGRVAATGTAGGVAANREPSLEAEADATGARIVQGFDLDAFLDFTPRRGNASGVGVVQGEELPPEEVEGGGEQFEGVPVKKCMSEVCTPRGAASAGRAWSLPEPLLYRFAPDVPLVDVTPGTTTAALKTPLGSASLASDGTFALGIKHGGLSASTDGKKAEAGVEVGPVSGGVASDGTVSAGVQFGPFKLGADTSAKVSATVAGAKLTYDGATGNIACEFTPELSWGPASVKASMAGDTLQLEVTLELALGDGWSISISQIYAVKRTITTDQATRAMADAIFDPFVSTVTGGRGTFQELLSALDVPH